MVNILTLVKCHLSQLNNFVYLVEINSYYCKTGRTRNEHVARNFSVSILVPPLIYRKIYSLIKIENDTPIVLVKFSS